jgi:phenylalanyl-tRNA synthetase beta chain
MRFSEAWLREWVSPAIDSATLADQLTMAGLEVDSVGPAAPGFSGVVVGEVRSVAPHPDADKLRVCVVDAGQGESLQIVCGAANVAAGMRVPVARVGAVLPGGFQIKRAKLRGVESLGMICSASELGLAESSSGILPLPGDAPVGRDFRDYLALDDRCIEVDLTPDRGDCLSVAGVAREVAVINRLPLTPPAIEPVVAGNDDRFTVVLDAPAACPRYVCRIVRGIDPAADTPLWMKERLRRGGVRSISPVVDVTNYVMLELGQPMHAFDLAELDREIRVRMARPGETLTLLSGETLELRADTLVIADATKPLALAGIMGGEHSGVGPATRDILFESAFFAPQAILGRARSYGQQTDASHRFERGVDPELQVRAVERATALLLAIGGGAAGPVVEAVAPGHLPARPPIRLRRARIGRILGVSVDDASVEEFLVRLGMRVSSAPDGWDVVPPSSRFDVAIEVDLIEEVGRIYGFSAIPAARSLTRVDMHAPREAVFDLDRARQVLVDRDYQEAITYSFVHPSIQRLLDPDRVPIALANPISAEMSVMRTTTWAGLLGVLAYNRARQQDRVRLFESGLTFITQENELKQELSLAGLVTGVAFPEQWGLPPRAVDFFDIKGDVEAVLEAGGLRGPVDFRPAAQPALHPGQCAELVRGGQIVGRLGLLHPDVERQLDLAGPVYLFELNVEALGDGDLPAFQPLSKYPSIRRDLAIVVDRALPFDRVRDCVRRAAPAIVKEIRLFDVYTGERIDSGLKSLALGLILQDSSDTLTDQRVDEAVAGIVHALDRELNARLRD